MNSKKIIIGLLMIVLAVYLGGCIEKECIIDDGVLCIPDDVLVIHINETYISEICGNYSISEFLVDISPLIIDGRDLIDPSGDRWVRD